MGPDTDPHPSGEQKQGQRRERNKEGRGGKRREFSLDRNNRTSHTIENLLLLLPARISQMTQLQKGPDTKGETVQSQLRVSDRAAVGSAGGGQKNGHPWGRVVTGEAGGCWEYSTILISLMVRGGSHLCKNLSNCNIKMCGLQNTRSYGYILELHHFLKVDNKTESGWMDGQRTDTHLVDMYGPFM